MYGGRGSRVRRMSGGSHHLSRSVYASRRFVGVLLSLSTAFTWCPNFDPYFPTTRLSSHLSYTSLRLYKYLMPHNRIFRSCQVDCPQLPQPRHCSLKWRCNVHLAFCTLATRFRFASPPKHLLTLPPRMADISAINWVGTTSWFLLPISTCHRQWVSTLRGSPVWSDVSHSCGPLPSYMLIASALFTAEQLKS